MLASGPFELDADADTDTGTAAAMVVLPPDTAVWWVRSASD
jgi:hypothetical protein